MTTPTIVQLPPYTSPDFMPPGTPGLNGNLLPANIDRYLPPFNASQGVRCIFPADPNVIPGSTLIPDAQRVMYLNGQTVGNQPILYFSPVPISSNTQPTLFNLPFRNNKTGIQGVAADNIYVFGGRMYDPAKNEYGQLTRFLGALG